jgi:hypothetical protein
MVDQGLPEKNYNLLNEYKKIIGELSATVSNNYIG